MNTSKRIQSILSSILVLWLAACDGSNKSQTPMAAPEPVQPTYDFTTVDSGLEDFVADHEAFTGASIIIEHKTWGIIIEAAYGDFTLDTRVALASVSKSATASLLMALASDPELDFDIDTPVENYLPWMGAYPGVTAGQMLSNTSGMPSFDNYLSNPVSFGNHLCQLPVPDQLFNAATLLGCTQGICETLLPDVLPPGEQFRYGWSQWQLAGGLAEVVGGASWAQLFDQYIAQPCGLETFEWARMAPSDWDQSLETLATGHPNPNMEAGGIASVKDLARLVSLHLQDGTCGDTQVLSESAVNAMRVDRGLALGSLEHKSEEFGPLGLSGLGYGLGWWVRPKSDGSEPSVFLGAGAAGAQIWFDLEREYSASLVLASYDDRDAVVDAFVLNRLELIPLIEEIIDTTE
jgi:CubicO group peptidase (beta-lactamase class C family)